MSNIGGMAATLGNFVEEAKAMGQMMQLAGAVSSLDPQMTGQQAGQVTPFGMMQIATPPPAPPTPPPTTTAEQQGAGAKVTEVQI